jgi:histidine triad (HIT) family protein
MDYQEDCLFCQIAAHKIPAQIQYEDDKIMAFDDINPSAKIHILVIPKKHIESISDIKDQDKGLVGEIVLKARDLAKEKGLTNGFRLVSNTGQDSGQIISHLHFHLLGGEKLGRIR